MNSPRKSISKLFIFAILAIVITTVLFCLKTSNSIYAHTYTFHGEDNTLNITNGTIELSSDGTEIVKGGDIEYKGEKLSNVIFYTTNLYTDNNGTKKYLISNSVSYKNFTMELPKQLKINDQIGKVKRDPSYTSKYLNDLINNLYFSLEVSTKNGRKYSFPLKLEVDQKNK